MVSNMRFYTDYEYTFRDDKPYYVWHKYKEILTGSVLDVGADKCGLKFLLPDETEYIGIGLGNSVDVEVDLENDKIPYIENSFNCVVCMDVLEHLDNIHEVFDELCRITSKYLIISLPNPWSSFVGMLGVGYYKKGEIPIKFHNLPTLPPYDRHKWFYGVHEAERFLKERGKKNDMNILQIDREEPRMDIKKRLYKMALKLFIHRDVNLDSLFTKKVWACLVKKQ